VRRLLKVRDARVYLTGQVFSLFGDTALWLAMGIWVKTLTGSNAAAGLVFFFANAPVLLAPLTGLLVDRVRRRPLLIAVNAATGGAVLLLLLVHGRGQVWLVYLVMTWYGLAYSVLGAAQSALLTTMLPADLLADANGALRTVQESLRLAGPLTGAGLFVLAGAHTVAILDAATFAVPVVCLLGLRVREPAPQPRRSHWRAELTAGVRHLARTPALRHLVIAAACAMAAFGFTETVIYAVAGTGLHEPPAFVGVLVAVQGAGAVVGGPTAAPLVRRIGEGRLVGLGMGLAGVAALLEIPPFLPSVLAGVILFGVSIPWLVVGFTTLLQRLTPPELQGRVYAAADTLVTTPQTVSIAVGAGLIGVTGYRPLLAALAVVVALAATYLLTRPEQRQLQQRQLQQGQPKQGQLETQDAGGVTSS
jgi:Na+/melibiose symporter-like transporter